MSTEESRVKEELGRPSLADSSSSLSILSAGLSLLVGFFIQTHHVFICTESALGRLTQEGSDTPNSLTPGPLAEGRQEEICPTQLNCGYLSKSLLVGWILFSGCQQRCVSAAVGEEYTKLSLASRFL